MTTSSQHADQTPPEDSAPVDEGTTRAITAPRIANVAIWMAIIAGLVGGVIGWFFFRDRYTPLSGEYSIGTTAGIIAGVTAGVSAFIGLTIASAPNRGALAWMRRRSWIWVFLDWVGLVVLHGAIAMLGAFALFRLFQQSFVGLTLDEIVATALVVLTAAGAAYFGLTSAGNASTRSLSSLLALYMVTGMIAAMLLAENPYWWHAFFSELGTGQAGVLSFWTFNTTITVSGIVLFALANFMSQDLRQWAAWRRENGKRGGATWMLRSGLMIIGACLVGVAAVPINVNDPLHTFFTQVLAVILVIMFLTIPVWFPGAGAAIYVFSYLMVALTAFAVALWWPLGYYNLTALELGVAGVLFSWLVVLIRALDSLQSEPSTPAAVPER